MESDMRRSPIVAGTFYESAPGACRKAVEEMLAAAPDPESLPSRRLGGLAPHAGWICSGQIAATTFKALQDQPTAQTIVLLDRGVWATPLGDLEVDEQLAEQVLQQCHHVRADPAAHANEHSLEVQAPFIQVLWPDAKILPLMAPASPVAANIGSELGAVLAQHDPAPLVIGSTDLTHYGPRYGVTPAGVGPQGIEWARENDRRLLELIEDLKDEQVVHETSEHLNACGAGAVAATIAACKALGAEKGIVLKHTNSHEVLKDVYPGESADAVGYASVVFV
jgi:hypothetical protein